MYHSHRLIGHGHTDPIEADGQNQNYQPAERGQAHAQLLITLTFL
jgi:hypothetical protein